MGKKDTTGKKKKFSSILTPEQKAKFKEFGEPDLSQNWLEIFTDDIISDLFTIMRSCSDNQLKADYICDELKDYGFTVVGLGTNIVTMANPYYPGVVFKIALDDFGIADNFNDCVLVNYVPRYNRVFARDPSAMISVQERLVLPTQQQMDLFMPRILQLLKEMSKYFLIADLSPDMFLNYGVTRDGDFRFIDASDLYPLSQMKKEPRCNRITGEHKHTGDFKYCEGKLKYSRDFKYLVCEKCGKEFMPLEFRPRKDVEKLAKLLTDGLDAEERSTLEAEEVKAILQREGNFDGYVGRQEETRQIFFDRSEEDDEEEEETKLEELEEEDDEEDEGPRTVFVDDEGFQMLKPREVTLPMTSDDITVDSPEAVEPADVDNSDINTEHIKDLTGISNDAVGHQETSTDTLSEDDASQGIMSSVSPDEAEDTSAFVALMGYIKKSDDPKDRSIYKGFLTFMRKAMNSAVADYRKEQEDDAEDISEHNEPTLADQAMKYCKLLSESVDPSDHKALQNIVNIFDINVENDSDNKNNTGETDDLIDPLIPHIHYRVVNDDGREDSDIFPGIFLTIYGDYDEAFAESGLPIYISVDDGKTMNLAADAYKIKPLLDESVINAYAELAFMEARHNLPESDTDEEEDDDDGINVPMVPRIPVVDEEKKRVYEHKNQLEYNLDIDISR